MLFRKYKNSLFYPSNSNYHFSLIYLISISFECPKFAELDKSKCNFDGKTYAPGEQITNTTHSLPTCTLKCTCKQ